MGYQVDQQLLRDVIRWDIANWSKALACWDSRIDWQAGPYECLEVGSWQGGLSIWLALKGQHVVCSDLEGIDGRAAPLLHKYGVEPLVECRDVDATDIPYENHFDIVIFKSVLGGIGRNGNLNRQKQAIGQIYKALKPGGRLLFAENLTGFFLHSFFRKAFVSWGRDWRYVTIPEMQLLLARFSTLHLETTGITGVFGRTENQKHLLARIDESFLNGITPAHWKYIVYGVAQK